MKKIALGFTAALIGTTGIASAAMAARESATSATATAGGRSASVAVDANPAGVTLGLPAVPSAAEALASVADADSPIPEVCSVMAGVPLPDAVASAVPAQVRALGNGAVIDASRVTGQQLVVTGATTLAAGCTTDLPAADVPALPALPAVSIPVPQPPVTIPSMKAPTAEVPSLPAVPAVPAVPTVPAVPSVPAVGDVVNQVTGTVAALPALSLASCSATGSASTSGVLGGLLGGVTATVNGSC